MPTIDKPFSILTKDDHAARRASYLNRAREILTRPQIDREARAVFDMLLQMSDVEAREAGEDDSDKLYMRARLNAALRSDHSEPLSEDQESMAEFRRWLRSPDPGGPSGTTEELRAMGVTTGAGGGYFVPAQFVAQVMEAAAQHDQLLDRSVVTWLDTPNGAPLAIPCVDDTDSSCDAQVIAESDPISEKAVGVTGSVVFGDAPKWKSGLVRASMELVQDSGIPFEQILAKVFGKRFARGCGRAFSASLVSKISRGADCVGASANTGDVADTSVSSIGSDDLFALMASVNPAYLSSDRCGFGMNWSTLISLLKLRDKNGSLVFEVEYDGAGRVLLAGKPVFLLPSLDSIGPSKKSVLFGDFSKVIVRSVTPNMQGLQLQKKEAYADYGQIAYSALWRVDSALAVTATQDSPIKFLEHPAA